MLQQLPRQTGPSLERSGRSHRRNQRLVLRSSVSGSVGLLLVALSGCEGTDSSIQQVAGQVSGLLSGAVSTGMNYPSLADEDELRLAQQNAEKIEAQLEEDSGAGVTNDYLTKDYLSHAEDPLLEDYLTTMTQRIVAVAKPRPFPYRTRVIMSPDVNAFTVGGGFIYIHAGLLARLETEDQLAFIIAHEVAHVSERHIPRGITNSYGMQALAGFASGVLGQTTGLVGLTPEKGFEYALNAAVNGYGRQLEAEADTVGLDYMVKAGYDPAAAVQSMQMFLDYYGDPPPMKHFFYSDHPTTRSRIQKLAAISTAKPKEPSSAPTASRDQEFARRTHKVLLATALLDYERGRFRTAEHLFNRALQVKADDMVPHYFLGRIALETGSDPGSVDRAVEHLKAAVSASPRFPPPYRYLGMARKRLGQDQEAVSAFKQYLSLAPDAVDADAIRQAVSELSSS